MNQSTKVELVKLVQNCPNRSRFSGILEICDSETEQALKTRDKWKIILGGILYLKA